MSKPGLLAAHRRKYKWCNARSRSEGLLPCYTYNSSEFKTGIANAILCDFTRKGYRLPTQSEWENASCGGAIAKNFPWGDTITHSQANYRSDSFYPCDVSPTRGYHPAWRTTGQLFTSPVGSFPANGFGLFDMIGNVQEWCYDKSGNYPASGAVNPIGSDPDSNFSDHVLRGGSWAETANHDRCASRTFWEAIITSQDIGFRVVRSSL